MTQLWERGVPGGEIIGGISQCAKRPAVSRMEAILNDLIPRLFSDGVFGDSKFVSVSTDRETSTAAQFTSEVGFATIHALLPSEEKQEIAIVIKIQPPDRRENELRDTYSQFHNEVIMYREILPFLDTGKANFYPKMYYGLATCGAEPDKDVVVMENMTSSGFSVAKEKLALDFQHISVALTRLGELHSWSYKHKKLNENKFFEIIQKLKIPAQKSEDDFDFNAFLNLSLSRGVQPLLDKNNEVETLQEFLKAFQFVPATLYLLMKPEDPFSVICHGDFCRNNIFFKYDNAGCPIDCAFFDFQQSKYSSPAIDLAFFLYMHTTAESREKHWEDFLKIYYKSVRDNLPDDIVLPDFDQFLDHFAIRAPYGYFHCSFFVPMMMLDKPYTIPEFRGLPKPEQIDYFKFSGGEEATKATSNIVSHMLQMKYIHKFLQFYRSNIDSAMAFIGKGK